MIHNHVPRTLIELTRLGISRTYRRPDAELEANGSLSNATTQRTSWSSHPTLAAIRPLRRALPPAEFGRALHGGWIGGVRSTLGPPVGLGTRLVSENGSVSRKSSGG